MTSTIQHQPPADTEAAQALLAPQPAAGMRPTAQTFYAVVNADGSLARGFQAASAQNLGDGFYEVVFTRDVSASAYIGTIGRSDSVGTENTGEITVVGRFGVPNGVFITTTDSNGLPANRGFHLAVHS